MDETLHLLNDPCSLSAKNGELQEQLRAAQAAADAATQARAAAEAAAQRQAQDALVAQEQLEAARRGRDEAAREAAELQVGRRGSRLRVQTEGVEGRAKVHVGLPPMRCPLQPNHTCPSLRTACCVQERVAGMEAASAIYIAKEVCSCTWRAVDFRRRNRQCPVKCMLSLPKAHPDASLAGTPPLACSPHMPTPCTCT